MKLKRLTLGVAGLVLLVSTGFAETRYFADLWNNFANYSTNLERKSFNAILGHYEGKLGLYLPASPVQIYGTYYGMISQSANYWDNSLFYGLGARVKPFLSYSGRGWYDEWISDVKIFAEGLGATYLKGQASAESSGLRSSDLRLGFDLWHEWNLDKPNQSLPWAEVWSNLSYRSTNFGWEDFNSYIFYFQPKLGWHLGRGAEVYLRTDAVISGKSGASYSFLNNADYGLGIRFEPWRQMEEKTTPELLRKFKMFFEVLSVTYLKEKPTDPNAVVNSDVRFGIDFSYGREYK